MSRHDVPPTNGRRGSYRSLSPSQRVSVVMIFLNPGEFFAEAVASVLAQTTIELELLLCDDGSSDGSTASAMAWAKENPERVRYLQHPGHANLGMSATRNLGIRAASADLIAFLDADDAWAPHHLRRSVERLLQHPEAAAVCGGAIDWTSWGGGRGQDAPGELAWPAGTLVQPPRMLQALLLRPGTRTPTCSLLVRRAVLVELGGAEERFQGMFEDQALLAKLFASNAVVIGDADSAFYRRHARSSSADAIRAGTYAPCGDSPARVDWLRWLREYLTGRPDVLEVLEEVLQAQLDRSRSTGSTPQSGLRRVMRSARRIGARTAPFGSRVLRRLTKTPPGRLAKRAQFGAAGLHPVSTSFGYDRGTPIDRHYIEGFLERSAYLIRGSVLEIGDDSYTRRFGGEAVVTAEVLNVEPGGATTISGDLQQADTLPRDSFDCMILTQTLHLLWDLSSAVNSVYEALRPGGVALVTVPFISQLSDDRWAEQWLWGISPLAAQRLFEERFGQGQVQIESFGNVRAASAFLQGFAVEDVPRRTLERHDPHYPMLVAIRAWKA